MVTFSTKRLLELGSPGLSRETRARTEITQMHILP